MIEALDIQVRGIVQGVGFRPFVYRTAKKYLVNGWVLNALDGVFVHAEAESKLLDEFVLELSENAPAAAQVKEIEMHEVPLQDCATFEIRFSEEAEVERTTLVSPDLATCDDCVAELFNPNDRRFRYPFINCTNCGPRFTIIDELPYDRPRTSMAEFAMCARCEAEYNDPNDRRFHAQPDACFTCGPRLTWVDLREGGVLADIAADSVRQKREESDALLARAVDVLREGGILAVKGLGGFHLVCDANNAEAVAKLRERKRRFGKAFAVMVGSTQDARRVCQVSDEEAAVLESAAHPIVLLKKRADAPIAPGVADKLPELGVMLPYTPVQHLLLHDFAEATASASSALPPMLVMTSGNLHDEPIVTDDAEACEKLAGVADAVLGNNRAILSRYDDSVVRVVRAGTSGTAVQFIRRARGYAPTPLAMPTDADGAAGETSAADAVHDAPVVFAAGPEQKNTFTLARGGEAFVSQHIGDMENAETYDAWLQAKARYQTLFNAQSTLLACDKHPEYLSTKWAREQALPTVEVQHHHAHIASVLGEFNLQEAVCGIAFDGTGFGADGAIWGGETLLCNRQAFERFANFAYVPMPGGAACVKHPLRMAYGVLWAYDLLEHPAAARVLEALGAQADLCNQMIEQSINTPYTSSVGRLFDAASAILGVCTEATYEGEPAILLEAAIADESVEADANTAAAEPSAAYAMGYTKNVATETSTAQDTSVILIDPAPVFEALLNDLAAGVPTGVIARRFHDAFVRAIVEIATMVNGVYGIATVALSGGVFMNRYLLEHALEALETAGFTAAINRDLPPNDGCISYGQAVVACSQNTANVPKE